ncbi:hypothetical protein [Nostoc flagelliforme]|uniref:hypothetical protein n=2 Tax=Nostoc flagelliforme TaxID=1306274 RepID=UPI0012FD43A7
MPYWLPITLSPECDRCNTQMNLKWVVGWEFAEHVQAFMLEECPRVKVWVAGAVLISLQLEFRLVPGAKLRRLIL